MVDGPLGKLARWLRIIGYDTTYDSTLGRMQLVERAIDEDRIILTGSKSTHNMCEKRQIKSVQIYVTSIYQQIKQLIQADFIISEPEISQSRCSLCNGDLNKTLEAEDLDQIPFGTKQYMLEIYKCNSCKHLYWEGSHWKKIRSLINQALSTDSV